MIDLSDHIRSERSIIPSIIPNTQPHPMPRTNNIILVIDRDSSTIIEVLYDDQHDATIAEGGKYEDGNDRGGAPVIFVEVSTQMRSKILSKLTDRRIDHDEIVKTMQGLAKSMDGQVTVTGVPDDDTIVTIECENGEYRIVFNIVTDRMYLVKNVTHGSGLGTLGECNEVTLDRIIRDIECAEDEHYDADVFDDDEDDTEYTEVLCVRYVTDTEHTEEEQADRH